MDKVIIVSGNIAYESSTVLGVAQTARGVERIKLDACRRGAHYDSFSEQEFEIETARRVVIRWDERAPGETVPAYRIYDASTDEFIGGGSDRLEDTIREAVLADYEVTDVIKH